jgi:hypothetical protein
MKDGSNALGGSASACRRAPELQIIVPLEGSAWVRLDAASSEDEERLRAWLRGPGSLRLYVAVRDVLEAFREERAA